MPLALGGVGVGGCPVWLGTLDNEHIWLLLYFNPGVNPLNEGELMKAFGFTVPW